jgi:hypothetical protein
MNCLLIRELPLKLIYRLFDAYISDSEGFSSLHVYGKIFFLKKL